MEKEIEVPSFVNKNYYEAREKEAQRQKKIEKLKVYKRSIKLIALGATLGVVMTQIPKMAQSLHDLAITIVENDNKNFEEEQNRNNQKVEELTGRSVEEITNSGMNR